MDNFSGVDLVQQSAYTHIPIITHNILIIIIILCGPYMCRHVFLWTVWRVPIIVRRQPRKENMQRK